MTNLGGSAYNLIRFISPCARGSAKKMLAEHGLRGGFFTNGRIACYPRSAAELLLSKFPGSDSGEASIHRLRIDPPRKMSIADINQITPQVLKQHIYGATYDLTNLHAMLIDNQMVTENGNQKEGDGNVLSVNGNQVGRLIDAIASVRTDLRILLSNPNITVEDILDRIDHHSTEELGFLNITLYRRKPEGDGKWVVHRRSTSWEPRQSRYDIDKGGDYPQTTLKSVIEADHNRKMYLVDIADLRRILHDEYKIDLSELDGDVTKWPLEASKLVLESFAKYGLTPDIQSIVNDLRNSEGPTQMIFVKLTSSRGAEAVVHIHNRAARGSETAESPLIAGDDNTVAMILKELSIYFEEAEEAIEHVLDRQNGQKVGLSTGPQILTHNATRILTDDLLFNPHSGIPYPKTPEEYRGIIQRITDSRGVFEGDSEPLTKYGTFSEPFGAVRHVELVRGGKTFNIEIFAPHLHATGRRNRLAFDADLLSQISSYDAYGTRGVSYERGYYYDRRLYNSDFVPFVRINGFPVSFAAVQGYETKYEDRDLFYAFLHFVMTNGDYQGQGLISYTVREIMSHMYFSNLVRHKPTLMLDSSWKLSDHRFKMWAFAHSGRLAAFHSFVRSFGGAPETSAPIAKSIIMDVHKRITPQEDLSRVLDFRGMMEVNATPFAIAADVGVYPAHTRYPMRDGKVVLPQSEVNLPKEVIEAWLDAIGGEEGVAAGNSLYFGGMVTLNRIRAAKSHEKRRQRGGQGTIESALDNFRSFIVRKTR